MNGVYLTKDGIEYLCQLIEQAYVGKETGKGLSTNDFTTTLKQKLDGIESGAQVNKVEVVKVNGVAVAIVGKEVDIDLSGYLRKSDVPAIYRPKGSCTWAQLIAKTDAKVGDVYNVTDKGGMNYACIVAGTAGESSWDAMGITVDLTPYLKKTEAQNTYANKSHSHEISGVTGLQDALNGKATPEDIASALEDYYDKTTADGRYAAKSHNHEISGVNGLQTALAGKASSSDVDEKLVSYLKKSDAQNTYAAKSHTHEISGVTGLQDALDGKLTENQLETWMAANFKPMTTEEIKAAFDARKS